MFYSTDTKQLEDQDQVRTPQKPGRRRPRLHRGRRRRKRLRKRRAVAPQVHPEDPDAARKKDQATHRSQLGRRFGNNLAFCGCISV